MVSSSKGLHLDQIQEESSVTPNGLLGDGKYKFYNFPNVLHGEVVPVNNLGNPGRPSPPPSVFWRSSVERDGFPQTVPSAVDRAPSRLFRVPFVRKISWDKVWKIFKQWIRNPLNMALFAWICCVAISGAILFLVMTGMLNKAIPKKSQRDTWFEVNNQILNALFTLMCLYQHPKRFHHLVMWFRWGEKDVVRLRNVYCKNGTPKPNEQRHMMVVLILLHLNCFAQYALCGLNLGYPRSKRPAIGVGLGISVAIAAPAIASVYNILSPLGSNFESETDVEAASSPDERHTYMSKEDDRVVVSRPEWVGGLLDFWDDIPLAYLSLFCSCCVFGWNMERLGFGNMYVHIVTFLLFCLAPFFIFNLAAVNLDNEGIREALGLAGFVLCVFGLLYGGFWRIRMRKRFNLPPSRLCCCNPSVADCFKWLCCCACALAQEVRTVDPYDVEDNKFYLKQSGRDSDEFVLSNFTGEDFATPLFSSGPSSPYPVGSSLVLMRRESIKSIRSSVEFPSEGFLPRIEELSPPLFREEGHTMEPPLQLVIEKEDGVLRHGE